MSVDGKASVLVTVGFPALEFFPNKNSKALRQLSNWDLQSTTGAAAFFPVVQQLERVDDHRFPPTFRG